MDNIAHKRFQISDRSYLNLVKRDITRLTESYGFTEAETGKVNIIVAEIASNLVKHTAEGGALLVKPLGEPVMGIEIISIDNGPGMKDVKGMMEDGVSTFGSRGEGLGAIKRLSTDFDLYSLPGSGTVLLSRFYRDNYDAAKAARPDLWHVRAVMVPKSGETLCGDGFYFRQNTERLELLVLDGLGHGAGAYEAASTGVEEFKKLKPETPSQMLKLLHVALKRTRGCVSLLVTLQAKSEQAVYSGIGNIAGRVFSLEGIKNLASYNGILGHNIPNSLHDQNYDWGPGKIMILHSDGLKSRWDLGKHPDLLRHDPSVIAAVLYKDFSRGNDDTLVAVVKKYPKAA